MNWDEKFMGLARHVAEWSKDRKSKCGCVIVGPNHEVRTMGYNGFPRGVDDECDEFHERPAKYLWTEHSERNAIYNAARTGIGLEGCTLYVATTTDITYPCVDCARAMVQTGIHSMVCVEPNWAHERWGDSFKVAKRLFDSVGFQVRFV